MRLSTTTSILSKESEMPRETAVFRALDLCKEAGFSHAELDLNEQAKRKGPLTTNEWEAWADKVKEYAAQLKISIHQGHSFVYRTKESTDFNLPDRAWHEERIRRSILAAGRIGIKWLVIHPADFAADETYDHKKAKDFNLSYWAPFLELAEKNQVGIAFENMFWSGHHQRFCSQVDELIDFVQSFNSPYAGICWDTGHANLAGQHQGEALRQIGNLLKAMHINDNLGKPKKDEHLIPFFGAVDWLPIIKALREIDYQGNFSFEVRKPFRILPKALNVDLLKFLRSVGEYMIHLA